MSTRLQLTLSYFFSSSLICHLFNLFSNMQFYLPLYYSFFKFMRAGSLPALGAELATILFPSVELPPYFPTFLTISPIYLCKSIHILVYIFPPLRKRVQKCGSQKVVIKAEKRDCHQLLMYKKMFVIYKGGCGEAKQGSSQLSPWTPQFRRVQHSVDICIKLCTHILCVSQKGLKLRTPCHVY